MSQTAVAQPQQQKQKHSLIGLDAGDLVLRAASATHTDADIFRAGSEDYQPGKGISANCGDATRGSETFATTPPKCLATFKAKVKEAKGSAARADNNNNNISSSGKNNRTETTPFKQSPVIAGKSATSCIGASKLISVNSLESIESKFSNDLEDANNNSSTNNTATTTSSDIIIDKIALSSSISSMRADSHKLVASRRANETDEHQDSSRSTPVVSKSHDNGARSGVQTFYEIELGAMQPSNERQPDDRPSSTCRHTFSLESPSKACLRSVSGGSDDGNNSSKPLDCDVGFVRKACRAGKSVPRRSSTRSVTPRFKNEKPPFKFAGIVVSIIGSLCFSTSALCIKLLPQNSPDGLQEKMRAVSIRGLIFMLLCSVSLYWQKSTIRVRREELWINVLRSIFGCMGIIGGYVSLCYISLGDSSALVFSSPVWTSLLSYFILGEPLHWILVFALPASLVGIILIAHPALIVDLFIRQQQQQHQPESDKAILAQLHENLTANIEPNLQPLHSNASRMHLPEDDDDSDRRWIGIGIALATSLCVSGVYIVLKFRKSTNIQTTTFWLGYSSCIAGLIAMLFTGFGEIPTMTEALLILINGFFAWLGQTCMQWGLFYESASILSVVRTSDVAISFALSAMFLDEDIYWTSVLGAAIIACVVVLMVLNNWFKTKSFTSIDGTSECDENKITNAVSGGNAKTDSTLTSEKQQHSNRPRNVYTICDDDKVAAA